MVSDYDRGFGGPSRSEDGRCPGDEEEKNHCPDPGGPQAPGPSSRQGGDPREDSTLAHRAVAGNFIEAKLPSGENLFHFLETGMEASTFPAFRKMF